ncbi:MAG: YdjY domain-containing protein [Planctomycetaceae bacterium]
MSRTTFALMAGFLLISSGTITALFADDSQTTPAVETTQNAESGQGTTKFPLPDGLTSLNPNKTVFIDPERKRVFLKSRVCLREGMLEMFACLAGTKEHEAVVAIDTEAYVIHAALLAVGAEPGEPVQFDPEYKPPTGQHLDIFVNWIDDRGRPYRVPAQYWMRHATRRYFIEELETLPADVVLPKDGDLRYDADRKQLIWFGPMTNDDRYEYLPLTRDEAYRAAVQALFDKSQTQPMEADFVFAGSGFWEDENGKKLYLAESGNVICVANFSDAIIDIDVKSDASNDALMFEPYTERIPPLETEVLVELVPRFEKEQQLDESNP